MESTFQRYILPGSNTVWLCYLQRVLRSRRGYKASAYAVGACHFRIVYKCLCTSLEVEVSAKLQRQIWYLPVLEIPSFNVCVNAPGGECWVYSAKYLDSYLSGQDEPIVTWYHAQYDTGCKASFTTEGNILLCHSRKHSLHAAENIWVFAFIIVFSHLYRSGWWSQLLHMSGPLSTRTITSLKSRKCTAGSLLFSGLIIIMSRCNKNTIKKSFYIKSRKKKSVYRQLHGYFQ